MLLDEVRLVGSMRGWIVALAIFVLPLEQVEVVVVNFKKRVSDSTCLLATNIIHDFLQIWVPVAQLPPILLGECLDHFLESDLLLQLILLVLIRVFFKHVAVKSFLISLERALLQIYFFITQSYQKELGLASLHLIKD